MKHRLIERHLYIYIGEGYEELIPGGTLHLCVAPGQDRALLMLAKDGHVTVTCNCPRCKAERPQGGDGDELADGLR